MRFSFLFRKNQCEDQRRAPLRRGDLKGGERTPRGEDVNLRSGGEVEDSLSSASHTASKGKEEPSSSESDWSSSPTDPASSSASSFAWGSAANVGSYEKTSHSVNPMTSSSIPKSVGCVFVTTSGGALGLGRICDTGDEEVGAEEGKRSDEEGG